MTNYKLSVYFQNKNILILNIFYIYFINHGDIPSA